MGYASSFAYTLLLALFYRLGFHNLELVATVIGIGSAALTAAIIFYTSAAFTRTWLAPVFMAIASAYHGFTSGWADSGMETAFYSLVVMAAVARFFVARKEDDWTLALMCLAAITRVEGIVLAGGWLLTRLLQCRGDDARRRLLRDGGWFLGVLGLLYGFKAAYYGTLLPHSFLFKEVAHIYQPQAQKVIDEWKTYAPFTLLIGVSGLLLLRRRSFALGLGAFLTVSAVAVLRGPWSHQARYSVPLFPALALLGALTLDALLTRLWPIALALTFSVYSEAVASHQHMRTIQETGAGHQACRGAVGQYLAQHVTPGVVVLSSDLGKIACKAIDLNFVDMFGLTSADVLGAYVHRRNADGVLESKRPRVVADTFYDPEYQALRFLNGGVTIAPVPPSQLGGRVSVSSPMVRCVSPDGISFQASSMEIR